MRLVMAIRLQDGNIYCLAAILSEICSTESGVTDISGAGICK